MADTSKPTETLSFTLEELKQMLKSYWFSQPPESSVKADLQIERMLRAEIADRQRRQREEYEAWLESGKHV